MKDSVDTRYAFALLNIAKEDKKIKAYQTSIKEIRDLLETKVELFNLLKSEFISTNERYEVVDRVFKSHPVVIRNFIKVLIQNHRINSYKSIFATFNSLCNEENHVLEGIVYSTVKLNEDKIKALEKVLKAKNKVDVELTNRIDPSLIGGIKVVINNHIYDYSIQNEINSMWSALKR